MRNRSNSTALPMLRRLTVIVGFALLAAHPARAAERTPLQLILIGNTMLFDYAENGQLAIVFEYVANFRSRDSTGREASGVWRVRGDELCLRQTAPVAAEEACDSFPDAYLGRKWDRPDLEGSIAFVEGTRDFDKYALVVRLRKQLQAASAASAPGR